MKKGMAKDVKNKNSFKVLSRKGLASLMLAGIMVATPVMLTGCSGEKGDVGAAGKSAYELAVEAGFEGTLQEWLDSLKGATGASGAKGEKGDVGNSGTSSYTHIKFAATMPNSNDDILTSGTGDYIGIYTGTSATAPTDYTEYTWSKIAGEDGAPGTSSYTYVKYANAMPNSNDDILTSGTGDYIGIYTGTSATAPTDYTEYTWSKIAGEDGTPGTSSYTYVKYANAMPDSDDDVLDTASDYIGIYTGTSATAPMDYTAYTWYKIKGEAMVHTPQVTIDKDGFIVIDGEKTSVSLYAKEIEEEISYNSNTNDDYEFLLAQGNHFGNLTTTRVSLSSNYKYKAGTTFKFVGNDVDYQWACIWTEDNVWDMQANKHSDSGWINSTLQSGDIVTSATSVNGYAFSYNADTKTVTLLKDGYVKNNFGKSNTSATMNTSEQDFANYIEINGIYYKEAEKVNIEVEEQETTVVDYLVNSVAHRGYSTIAPENTLAAYRLAKEKGFTTVECDVSFTSDGVAVLLHDSTIDRTSNGSGSIANMTLEQVRQYDFGSWKSSEYVGEKIPTFEEFLSLCKSLSLHPYIEIKDGATQTEVESLVTMVARYGMIDDVTWISFQSDALTCVKNKDNTARLGYLVSTITSDTINTVKSLKTDQNEVFVDAKNASLTEQTINLCIAELIPLEVWTVNDVDTILNLDPYISGITSDDKVAGKILYENNKD